ncbi:MAG: glycosyltransferase family 4 protein [Rikenellaceae bacterium]|nr:glycosyltransferase family 4 protein [Rikenellaceae bacterium]MBR2628469.1 glycosyltransferase family 4 protein [Alistipes sp.]
MILKLILITIFLVVLELVYFKIADRFNIIDKPNERSSHKSVVLRGGGIIFLFGIWLYAAFNGLMYPWFIAGVTAIGVISFIDDVCSIPNKYRLMVQFASMLLMFQQLDILNLQSWWILLLALIFCVGIINAYNFMDGINGITGGYSIAVLIPLIYLNQKNEFVSPELLYVMLLSLLVFCFFNYRKKAKCFAGDVGAVSIAFALVFVLARLILQTGDLSYIVLLAVYGVDSILTIVHRIMLHENLGQAHRKHAYQIMANELKIPHVTVSSIYALLQLAISFGFILLPINHWLYMSVAIVLLCLGYVLFKRKYYHLHEAYLNSNK